MDFKKYIFLLLRYGINDVIEGVEGNEIYVTRKIKHGKVHQESDFC